MKISVAPSKPPPIECPIDMRSSRGAECDAARLHFLPVRAKDRGAAHGLALKLDCFRKVGTGAGRCPSPSPGRAPSRVMCGSGMTRRRQPLLMMSRFSKRDGDEPGGISGLQADQYRVLPILVQVRKLLAHVFGLRYRFAGDVEDH